MKNILCKAVCFLFTIITIFTLVGCESTTNNSDNILKPNCSIVLDCGNGDKKTVKVDKGDALSLNFTPHKQNYMFKGWYVDSNCTQLYDFTRPVETDFTLYAGHTLSNKVTYYKDCNIKLGFKDDFIMFYQIDFSKFDVKYLEEMGYGFRITLNYSVKYVKDYDVLWDIGYAGSPKYEVTILKGDLKGFLETGLPTTTDYKSKSFSKVVSSDFGEGNDVVFTFSTDNIQNIIYFRDIIVSVEIVKIR
ncbi:MAG: hypothetical protein E7342_05120 [Clostridiales bacterium]|nr:hypothetical protein [Clostridiales bacterium]